MANVRDMTDANEVSAKIGIFLCSCGTNIAGTINLEKVREVLSSDPNNFIFDDLYLCSEAGLEKIRQSIKQNLLNSQVDRIVIAACTPKLHQDLFNEVIGEIGFNPAFIEIANVREQASWVHTSNPEGATEKVIDLIKMAIARVKNAKPIQRKMFKDIIKRALVIGGGIAGIKASLAIADSGHEVYLVEKKPSIGGHMARYDKVFPTFDCAICILAPLMVKVSRHPNITLLTQSEIKRVGGFKGNFQVEILKHPRFIDEEKCTASCIEDCSTNCPIEVPDDFNGNYAVRKAVYLPFPQAIPFVATIDESCIGCKTCEAMCGRDAINFNQKEEIVSIDVGAIIVAVGFKPLDPTPLEVFGYNEFKNVITSLEMERMLSPTGPTQGVVACPSDGKIPKRVAFLQCVGSRDLQPMAHSYCSGVCCMYSIKHAIELARRYPGTEIYILYIDIRTPGKNYEEFYMKAQEMKNIHFIRGRVGEMLEDPGSKRITIRAEDTLLCELIELEVDLAVLAIALEPSDNSMELANHLKVAVDHDGFYQEEHPKIKPETTTAAGVYVAGCIQGPKDIQTSIMQAEAAAMNVINLIQSDKLEVDTFAPIIDPDLCRRCLLCELSCDKNIIEIKKDKIQIHELACAGCGNCAAVCPNNAMDCVVFSNEQILGEINAIAEEKKDFPLIIGFFCNWCSYAAADLAGIFKIEYPTNIRIIRAYCTGRINPQFIVHAFMKGVDGVLIAGCQPQDCHYRTGFHKASQRVSALKELLAAEGINPERLEILSASATEAQKIAEEITRFTKKVETLGPSGIEIMKLA